MHYIMILCHWPSVQGLVMYNISMCAVYAFHWNAFVRIEGRPLNSNHENRTHVDRNFSDHKDIENHPLM